MKHGTRSGYVMGCFCDECKAANKEYRVKYIKDMKLKTLKNHGTLATYNDYGCRCDLCRDANNNYSRMYRAL